MVFSIDGTSISLFLSRLKAQAFMSLDDPSNSDVLIKSIDASVFLLCGLMFVLTHIVCLDGHHLIWLQLILLCSWI